jgi:AraC family transcriptional regulator of adaptative response/methylated-DNA-[protein]-cysteine methyltransferase
MNVAMTKSVRRQASSAQLESNARWTALASRDTSLDGTFVYAVTMTGIYCRPACPSKLAKREHVVFFESCEDAEEAGFRACKRCRPTAVSLEKQHAASIAKACCEIENAKEAASLEQLAQSAGMSAFHFQRLFKSVTGVTPKVYAAGHQAKRIRDELVSGNGSVTDAIYAAGFNSSSRFYTASNAVLGMTPSAFRAGGKGATIRFAIGECSLGSILVACSEKGVCAIFLGDDPEALARDLQDRFPKAQLCGGEPEFEALVATVVGFVEAPALGLNLPLDVQGTAFQLRVWQALRDIPFGETASYTEIAQRIGAPKAVRAVAAACAANRLSVVIPCHRVVRNDGALSGYRWGVARKRVLLDREAKMKT